MQDESSLSREESCVLNLFKIYGRPVPEFYLHIVAAENGPEERHLFQPFVDYGKWDAKDVPEKYRKFVISAPFSEILHSTVESLIKKGYVKLDSESLTLSVTA